MEKLGLVGTSLLISFLLISRGYLTNLRYSCLGTKGKEKIRKLHIITGQEHGYIRVTCGWSLTEDGQDLQCTEVNKGPKTEHKY
jgi:hypothetical protein